MDKINEILDKMISDINAINNDLRQINDNFEDIIFMKTGVLPSSISQETQQER